MVNGIKGVSSRWLNATMEPLEPFRWQRGYGLFTVSPKDLNIIINYIKKQKEHHSNGSLEPSWENES
ncbi:transposase [Nonlabens sp. Hel1_33_55]|uniref:transposase n=1 Tax=Nonlabens sp. Hel1_33_55 TaxID=1336802 RepID=UPI003977734E